MIEGVRAVGILLENSAQRHTSNDVHRYVRLRIPALARCRHAGTLIAEESPHGTTIDPLKPLLALSLLAAALFSQGVLADNEGLAVTPTEVTVGQLHSATGTMAISETGSIQAERLAIEQINASGGILGRQIKVIQEDGASDWPTFAEKAKKLLVNDKVAAVFGCWTSASRKAVLPIFEKENGLLYYPTFYEGLEQSKT